MIRQLAALSLLSLSAGCFSSGNSTDGALPGATNLSPDSLLAEEDNDDDAGDSGVVCPQPIGEVSLAEAVDRGFARLGYDGSMFIDNEGPVSISMDGWFVFFSESSQDAIGGSGDYAFGHADQGDQGLSIPPGGEWAMDYAAETGPAWWCIEETQTTQISMDHRFNGAEAPPKLLQYVFYNTDENGNDIEDHDDFPDEGGLAPQAQHNIWDTLDEGAIFVVGRSPNYVELQVGESTDLTVQVVNLGRGAGSAIVSETIPAGASASDFSLEPGIITDNADGSRTYTWAWKMGGAEDNGDLSQPTIYDRLDITYTLTWEATDCGGRSIGAAPRVDWSDSDGLSHISWGTELVVACCQ